MKKKAKHHTQDLIICYVCPHCGKNWLTELINFDREDYFPERFVKHMPYGVDVRCSYWSDDPKDQEGCGKMMSLILSSPLEVLVYRLEKENE